MPKNKKIYAMKLSGGFCLEVQVDYFLNGPSKHVQTLFLNNQQFQGANLLMVLD